MSNGVENVASANKRLTPLDRNRELSPLRRAYNMTRCCLYWIPVSAFPAPAGEKQWLMEFFDRFIPLVKEQCGARAELFLQYKTVVDVMEVFQKTAMEFAPILGVSRRPGAALRPSPTSKELAPFADKVLRGESPDFKEFVPDYCYWFHRKLEKRQRKEFLGYGGLSMIFLKADPKTTPPELPFTETFRKKNPIFQMMDVDGFIAGAYSLMDAFHPKSKEMFAADLKDDPRYPGIVFVLPLLSAADFFGRPAEECESWFQLFDVYVNESPADKGILVALKEDMEEQLVQLLKQMKEDGHRHPAG